MNERKKELRLFNFGVWWCSKKLISTDEFLQDFFFWSHVWRAVCMCM